ncbi:hypothetical protein [Actinomadura sp. 6N118]|uniref:hypothetical protein n=1 Tax=Actinomadura sp. 6N118 TaxID=3375151 RepID=UPI0037B2674C
MRIWYGAIEFRSLDAAHGSSTGEAVIKARVLAVTRLVTVLLVPIAFCRAPGRARFLACGFPPRICAG